MPDGPTYEDCGLIDPYTATQRVVELEAEIERLRARLTETKHVAVYLAGALVNPKLKDTALNKLEALLASEQKTDT